MHKLRLRTRSTATTSKDSNADSSSGRTRSPEIIGRSSTSTSISNGNSRTSSDKGKGKEKGGGFKASIRQLSSDSSSKKSKAAAIPQDSHAPAAQSTTATATLRPQLTLPKGDDFRTSLILVSSLSFVHLLFLPSNLLNMSVSCSLTSLCNADYPDCMHLTAGINAPFHSATWEGWQSCSLGSDASSSTVCVSPLSKTLASCLVLAPQSR